jgi:hypothetical protein
VADHQHTEVVAQAEKEEPVFIVGMIGVEELDGVLIVKGRLCFLEGNAVFSSMALFFLSSHSNRSLCTCIVSADSQSRSS